MSSYFRDSTLSELIEIDVHLSSVIRTENDNARICVFAKPRRIIVVIDLHGAYRQLHETRSIGNPFEPIMFVSQHDDVVGVLGRATLSFFTDEFRQMLG